MTQIRIIQTALLTLVASISLSSARADVAPPPDYVEECTLEKKQVEGTTCVTCRAFHFDVNTCVNQYSPEGYTKICRAFGGGAWTEVHCKPTANGTAGAAGMPGVAGAAGAGAPIPSFGGASSNQLIAPVTGGATVRGSSVATGGTPIATKTTSAVDASTGGASATKASTTPASTTTQQAAGGSATEVPKTTETTETPKASEDDGGCSISGRRGNSAATATLVLAALALLGVKRRRRGA